MQISGLNKTTLLDYPEHVACTIFLTGCNFRCPFCHNGDLVLNPDTLYSYTTKEIFDFLKKRQNILSGVCISGGEPTCTKELPELISEVKSLGYFVKLDTNGSNPQVLVDILEDGLLDYVAMDIKSDAAGYAKCSGLNSIQFDNIRRSAEIIREKAPDYEFRTTVVKELHTNETFLNIGKWLDGSTHFFIQNFKESDSIITKGFTSHDKETAEIFAKILFPHFKKVGLRGWD